MLRMIHPHRIQPGMNTASDLMTSQGEIRIEPLKQMLDKEANYCMFIAESLSSRAWHCGTCVILASAARDDTTNTKFSLNP